ncbi:MAG: hypothetical protein HY698_06305 [Deltaproteobacteria bacterium]|nr:hypothetical protein [Deltaproteobacteria bacterium]
MTRTLVAGAYAPEIVGVGTSARAVAIGIGPIEAAAGMAAAIAAEAPERVILIGTCGAFHGAGLAIGDVVVVEEAVMASAAPWIEVPGAVPRRAAADPELVRNLARIIHPWTEPDGLDASSRRSDEGAGWGPATEERRTDAPRIGRQATGTGEYSGLAETTGYRVVRAASCEGITVDDQAAQRIASDTRAHVEHMECFAVFRACARAGVPVAALLAVANHVGEGARKEWQVHAKSAEQAAILALGRVL